MPEPSTRRDPREIAVPSDMRADVRADPRPGRASSRAAVEAGRRAGRDAPPPGEFRAAARAMAALVGRVCRTRPGEVAGTLAALGAAAYVSLNALGYQEGRHPAPILPQAAAAKSTAVSSATSNTATKPEPGRTDAARTEGAAAGKPEAREAARAPQKDRPEARHAEKPAPRDAIGDILRAADDTTASVTPKAERADRTEKTVASAQKALTKLGYGTLKTDGLMGPTTRAAIEKFERDRKLPVTGEAAGRTLRELVARANAKG